jgi:hypothetical protein
MKMKRKNPKNCTLAISTADFTHWYIMELSKTCATLPNTWLYIVFCFTKKISHPQFFCNCNILNIEILTIVTYYNIMWCDYSQIVSPRMLWSQLLSTQFWFKDKKEKKLLMFFSRVNLKKFRLAILHTVPCFWIMFQHKYEMLSTNGEPRICEVHFTSVLFFCGRNFIWVFWHKKGSAGKKTWKLCD